MLDQRVEAVGAAEPLGQVLLTHELEPMKEALSAAGLGQPGMNPPMPPSPTFVTLPLRARPFLCQSGRSG